MRFTGRVGCAAALSVLACVVGFFGVSPRAAYGFDHTPAPPVLYYYDIDYASGLPAHERYDLRHATACIQGLANRDAPRLFVKFFNGDGEWLGRLTESGGLCEGWPVVTITSFEDLIATFGHLVDGVVLYDPSPFGGVISTSLVATTAAGVEDAIAVRKDTSSGSMYNYLLNDANGPQLSVLIDLTGKFTGSGTIWQTSLPSSGSAKCDAYLWAVEKYIKTGRCNPTVLMYTLDLWGLTNGGINLDTQLNNLDYAVSQRGFCFELSPWGDEIPNDDPGQPLGTDFNTFLTILDACNQQTNYGEMIQACGFVNWKYKYTDHAGGSHGAVSSEWEQVKILSAYNAYLEADALGLGYISNSSLNKALAPIIAQRNYVQNPAPSYGDLQNRGLINGSGNVVDGNYVMIGLGDYDQASWTLYWLAGQRYEDGTRGQVDCNWAVNPNAVDRAAMAMDYMYRNKTNRDWFMAWDSGCGYVNPSRLHGSRWPSGYPSGVDIFRRLCKRYYRMFDYSITGWLLNGSSGSMDADEVDIYIPFSGDGVGMGLASSFGTLLRDNVPAKERYPYDWFGGFDSGKMINHGSGVHFAWYRSILRYPNQVKSLADSWAGSGNNHQFLDAFTFYYLLRHHLGGNNDYRATWMDDTVPRYLTAGEDHVVQVTIRNDGWDTWDSTYGLGYAIVPVDVDPTDADFDANPVVYIEPETLLVPGGTKTFTITISAPYARGDFAVHYDLQHDGKKWFRNEHNIQGRKDVFVTLNPDCIDTDRDGLSDPYEVANGGLYWYPNDGIGLGGVTDPSASASSERTGHGQLATDLVGATNEEEQTTTDPAMMWSSVGSDPPGDLDPSVTINLQRPYWVTGLDIWNYNEPGLTAIGVSDMRISYSTNGVDFFALDSGNDDGRYRLAEAPGTTDNSAQFVCVGGPILAAYIRFDQMAPHGDPDGKQRRGLSEVRLHGVSVQIAADFDDDGDVDGVDFAHLQTCLGASGIPNDDPECQNAKLDQDEDVDQLDLGILMDCFSGPETTADPLCVDQ